MQRAQPARAALVLAAVIVSFCATYALCRAAAALPGPAVLSAIIAMSLGRTPALERRHLILAPFVLAGTALAAAGVAWLLLHVPPAGAALFVAGIFASIYLRNFGGAARRAGSLVAMPLVGILIAPARADAPGGIVVDVALIAAAGIIALLAVAIAQFAGRRAGIGTMQTSLRLAASRAAGPEGAARTLTATTRLALQMAVALGVAFVTGFALFPGHWGWTVLTAFIVASGARGRGDVIYKGVQRLGGALAGTLLAALLIRIRPPSGVWEAVAIFAILYAGFALRPVNYAYWAACMTLVLALLVQPNAAPGATFLVIRLAAILIGAICAVAAAWFVMPIRTSSVVRKRLAEALRALDDCVSDAHREPAVRSEGLARFDEALAELEAVEAPVRLHRRVLGRGGEAAAHPATWFEQARTIAVRARTLDGFGDERSRAQLRKAIGTARRATANFGKADASGPSIGEALEQVRSALEAVTRRDRGERALSCLESSPHAGL